MTVDEFIKSSSHPLKKELTELRRIISKAAPTLTEQIKWNAPSFCHNGDDRITFNLSKQDAVLLIFHRGAKSKKLNLKSPILKNNADLLEWPAPDRAVMKIKSMEEVGAMKSKLSKIVNDWIAITNEYGS
jgi:hypothetical protein